MFGLILLNYTPALSLGSDKIVYLDGRWPSTHRLSSVLESTSTTRAVFHPIREDIEEDRFVLTVISCISTLPCTFDNVKDTVLYYLNCQLGYSFYIGEGRHLHCGSIFSVDKNVTFPPLSSLEPSDELFYSSNLYEISMYEKVVSILAIRDTRVSTLRLCGCTRSNKNMLDDTGLFSIGSERSLFDNLWYQPNNLEVQQLALESLDDLEPKTLLSLYIKTRDASTKIQLKSKILSQKDMYSVVWSGLIFGCSEDQWNIIRSLYGVEDCHGNLLGMGIDGVINTELTLTTMVMLKTVPSSRDLRSLEKSVSTLLIKDGQFVVSSEDDTVSLLAACWYIFYATGYSGLD